MIERRSCLCLPAETLDDCEVARQIIRQELNGDETIKSRIFGPISHTHSAAADFFEDPIMRNNLTDE